MAVNIPGLITMVLFYLLVMVIGIWAARKSKAKKANGGPEETLFLANRSVGLLVGVFTMTATWVGGAFVIGVAESVYDPTRGLVWALLPLQMSISFVTGGLLFSKPMRDKNYMTMMDPFQIKYGKRLTAFLAIVPTISEIMWVPVTEVPMGIIVRFFSGLPLSLCIWICAAVAIAYTMLGGLYSVAFTDVMQLSLVLGSLWLCVPFVLVSDVYSDIAETAVNSTDRAPWLGQIEPDEVGSWIDNFLAMSIGNLAFQDFHQRILSSSSSSTARRTCFIAAGVVIFLGVPPVLIGTVAASTDWNMTSYGAPSPYERGEGAMVFPIVLQHLTPTVVFLVGMGAIAGAAMSSIDSCLLAATSIFTNTIYRTVRPQASVRELQWVVRFSILFFGVVGTSLTYLDSSTMTFWLLSSDLTYTIMLPQLVCIVFCGVSNGYGAIAGFLVALVLRALCGEPTFNLPVVLRFPGCTSEDGVYVQRWPFKSVCMLSSLVSILVVSHASSLLFNRGILPERWDVFKVKSRGAKREDESNEMTNLPLNKC